jgi:hypothetical protein
MDRTAKRIVCLGVLVAIAVFAVSESRAQTPDEPAPAVQPLCARRGRIHRLFHHVGHTTVDKFTGYPDNFIEPPLGYYLNEQLGVQVAKANTHRFTLYRSDFLPGTTLFSPAGASRLNVMARRIPGWTGPITIEWTPDQPELAEQRRIALVETMQKAGLPLLADRVVIAPSPYPGAMGVEAVNHSANIIMRSAGPAPMFPLPPMETAATGVH